MRLLKVIQFKGFDSVEEVNLETNYFSRINKQGEYFVKDSNAWLFRGIAILNNFGYTTKVLTPDAFFNVLQTNKSTLWHKNGKAKFRVLDTDHGTNRMWLNSFKSYEVYSFYKPD